MTNEDIIKTIEGLRYPDFNNSLSAEMFLFIRQNYEEVARDTKGGKWYRVYCDGTDCKYGRIAIDPYAQKRRGLNFDEFYGGAIVD